MMRRKKQVETPKPVHMTDGAPTLPPRPPELAKAQATLQKCLEGTAGAHVAAGYGFGDLARDRTPAWRLFVFTDDDKLELPTECEGFPVARRIVPRPGPAWGKMAKG